MRHILPFLGKVLPRSLESWGRVEVVITLLAYILLALATLGILSPLDANLVAKIGAALAVSAIILLVAQVLIITPAKMWGEAQERIEELEQQKAAEMASEQITVGGHAVMHSMFVDSPLTLGATNSVQQQPIENSELAEDRITGRTFLLYEVPRDRDNVIRDRSFENCTIMGPAVMALAGKVEFLGLTTITGRIDGSADPVLWEVPKDSASKFGAIGVERCSFRDCEFVGIGIAATPDIIEMLRVALEKN